MTTKKTQKIPKIITLLQKKYDCVTVKSKLTLTELIIYATLNEGETKKNTDKALNKLKEEFVDWNEVRVTHPREIEEALKDTLKGNTYQKAVTITEVLGEIFYVFNTLQLAFLLEQEFIDVHKQLLQIDSNYKLLATLLLHIATNSEYVTVQQTCVRVGKRIGLWNETTPSSLNKNINKNTEKYLTQLNVYLSLYGEDVCVSTGYDCNSCILLKECDFGQKRVEKKTKSPATTKKRKTEVAKKVSRSRQKSSKK
ncbi:hypothetical protein [Candidatus Uabimicrobium amorphum]|uniref:Endonuclease III n=1 Tax=Uabimicrobium amorphum TaxID=2596890 RepID=A0A5S9ITD8_UABAM|nr:hypothetical protein [Candidatus Uabimicrobium amorphum]BBM87749.1 hypothetical protein UABAM_06164 [Candidatus Uabimicrobium amorphum]